ncbi:MAG: CaiB/BaiF CoA-transferase family protein, partial [bacterium]
VQVFRRMVGTADVVVESFRAGTASRLDIGYDKLKKDNRKLIYCSLTGYGQDGPYSARAGHDLNFLALSGLASLTGPEGGPPVPPGVQVGDIAGGAIMAAFGIMSALYSRERTGRGQYLDVSMLDGLLSVGQNLIGEAAASGNPPGPGSMRLNGGYPPYNIYETRDGKYFALAALEEKFWNNFCEKVEREDLKPLHHPETEEQRVNLEKELEELFKSRTRDEWTSLLADGEACASPVLDVDEVPHDPHVAGREMIVEGPHPREGKVPQVAFPLKFSEAVPREPGPAPELGEHTDEILTSIGYNKDEIRIFREKGVI